jgi:NhaA family Na+:H+ antiporter
LFGRSSASTDRTIANLLRNEKSGGILLLLATVAALAWANSPWSDRYFRLLTFVPWDASLGLGGGPAVHTGHTLAEWATDGILAIFFFVVGLELKREIVAGELRRPSSAALPIAGAIGGMILPAVTFLAVNAAMGDGSTAGWAIPTATDIAFALAVLAVVGKQLPNSVRAFLLTLAVVDDLFAILIIAMFYTPGLQLGWLAAALVPLFAVAWLARRGRLTGVLLAVLGVATWALVEESGVHATIAGVALGLVIPATSRRGRRKSPVEYWEHRVGPTSSLVAIPVFAFFAAGVTLSGDAVRAAAGDPVAMGVALGLMVGKPLGIFLAALGVAAFTRARLNPGLSWWDIAAIAGTAGIGFTVSLLIGDLAYGSDPERASHVKAAVLVASTVAAAGGGFLLWWRDRQHRSRPKSAAGRDVPAS